MERDSGIESDFERNKSRGERGHKGKKEVEERMEEEGDMEEKRTLNVVEGELRSLG